ncbi:EAL domain-containing protein [Pseudoalteromonas sp. S1612]|uniref:EAL domain-containing protein n=1 Tax=Pseudoalteromonas sp. S1612 TaxID=579507 RepID=UPI00201E4DE9|nr:EAL domain-containing protein [Pseudoalteromonas sp. S1612]
MQQSFASQTYSEQLQRASKNEQLAQSFVVKSVQDDIGYVWIATTQGLFRFDGYQVTPYENQTDLKNNYIINMYKTNNGSILVSTQLAGSYLIDPSSLKAKQIYSGHLNQDQEKYSPVIAVVEELTHFYFSIDSHVYRFDKKSKQLTLVASLPDENMFIRALSLYQNTLYIGSDQGLYNYSFINNELQQTTLSDTQKVTNDSNNVKFLSVDQEFGLMVGTVEGMYRIAFDENKNINPTAVSTLISDYNIWDYVNTPYGEFIATESGLFEFDRATLKLTAILNFKDSSYNITENTINDIMFDESGLLWLGSRTHGVLTWAAQTKKFKRITLPENNIVNVIYQDTQQLLWIGTDDGLVRYNSKTKTSDLFLQSKDNKAAYGLSAIGDIFPANTKGENYLWLATFFGLELFNKETGTFEQNKFITEHNLNTDYLFGITQVAPDKFAYINNDNFYIFDGNSGENRVIKGLKELVSPLQAYAFHTPSTMFPGELLLSTSDTFYRYNEATGTLTAIFKSKTAKKNLYHTVENYYYDAKRKLLWLATTQEGLIAVNAETYEQAHTFNKNNSLNTNSIFELIADDNDFLWVSSDNGLYKLNLDSLNVTTYTIKDGLSSNHFTALAALKLQNNELVFGNRSGVLQFDPDQFKSKQQNTQSKLAITNINLFSETLNYTPEKYRNEPLKLKHDDMGLTVRFSNFDYKNISKTFYRVELTGPSSLSYNDLKSNQVFFTKLQPGDYVLSVSTQQRNGVVTSEPVRLKFSVAYAPWQSPLAYACYFLAVTIILFLFFWQYRSRKIAIERAHRAAIHSKTQTELALKSNKSGVWNYSFADNTVNTARGMELGFEDLPERIDIQSFFNIMHPDERRRIQSKWDTFIKQTQSQDWQATYRLRHKDGHWLWFHDLGQIIYNQDTKKPEYVSGIFTNITEQLANEQQAKILGEAFSQINDFLLILDENLMPFSANNSFMEVFSDDGDEGAVTSELFIKAIGQTKCKEFAATLKALQPKENWRTNAYVNTTKAQQHPIHLSATAVANEEGKVGYYVIVITDLTEQKRAENELRYLANYDALTGLPNRSLMNQKIENAITKAAKNDLQCAVIFIDLDKFKPVNDSFGHAVGDKLLCNITERVGLYLGDHATFGRQSGDEFLVLIENITSMSSLQHTLNEMSSELASKVIIEDFSINISASIGIALYPHDANSTDALIRNADIAMMHAKQAGRNGFQFFNEKMNEQIKQKLILENDLKDAAKDNQFFNHYQPVVNTKDKTISGVELLMRWENQGKLISPALFIPVAEETGLIDMLTEQALQRAITELAPVLSVNPLFYISLNVSPKHILKANITQRLSAILEKANIKPQQIRLEITENTLLEDKHKAAKQLKSLQAAGFKLFLDDFGTGYSSLTYLSQFPINVIKIDQSFVNSIGIDKGDESIIKTIYSLAENLELYCIAEGVETREQLDFLTNIGCHKLQGYYFARPMSASDLMSPACFEKIIDLI